jgi:integrase
MCRRTFGALIEGDVKDVQDMMGHYSETVTLKHYKKAISHRQRQSVEDLDRRISDRFARNCTRVLHGIPVDIEVQ